MVILMKNKIFIYVSMTLGFFLSLIGTILLLYGALKDNNNLVMIALIIYGVAIVIFAVLIIICLIKFRKGTKKNE